MNESSLKFDPEVIAAQEDYREQRNVEDAIMKLRGYDYGAASDLFAAFQAKLEGTYEDHLDAKVDDTMKRLAVLLAKLA